MMNVRKTCLLLFSFALTMLLQAQQAPLRLWFDSPAPQWEAALPLGNGRLGMMPDGGITKEKVVLNEISLWSGSEQDANNYEAYKNLPAIRSLLLEGKNDLAQALVNKTFVCKGKGSGHGNGANVPFGCYQVLGNLYLRFTYKGVDSQDVKPETYRRELSLDDATATCSYSVNGVSYRREYFTSFVDDVGIIKLSADKPGKLNFTVSIDRPERFAVSTEGNELQMAGQLNNGTDGKGMLYMSRVKASAKGGKISVEQNSLVVKDASEVVIYISSATDFRGNNYKMQSRTLLDAAMKKPYSGQKAQHVAKFQKLFSRVKLNLGKDEGDAKPTDKRLLAFFNDPGADNGMATLYFQYGRYLGISSTRVGLLPPNLQGLWAEQIQTPWNGDYHLDVNVQMNHWPLEVANLSELNLPLVDLVKGLVKPGEKTARAYYNAEGWVAHVITNVWGYTEPGEDASWGATNSGSGWLCNNLWEHYEFTGDKKYLQSIYPVLKGAAQFYQSVLIKDPSTGWLVTAPSVSPENSFYMANGKTANICIGPTVDNQIIRELFNNVVTATTVLRVDESFKIALQENLKMLPPPGVVGKDGRLMEWLEEYKETDPKHRHVSHLYGVYPAPLINQEFTPELAKAAVASLNVRGDDGTGWSKAYKLLFWARLQDGNRAYKLLTQLLKPTSSTGFNMSNGGGTYPNLFCAHPPFQIDGNFGGTAGIAEMLIQSHAGYINLLPAVPDAWKISGEVKGLKARGNFTVDMSWKDGKVTGYRVSSPGGKKVSVKVNGEVIELQSRKRS